MNSSKTAFVTDANGNVLGGIRTPQVVAAVAKLSGIGQPGSASATARGQTNDVEEFGGGCPVLCGIFGTTVPLSSSQLAAPYPSHEAFVKKSDATTAAEVREGYLLEPDAVRSTRWRPPRRSEAEATWARRGREDGDDGWHCDGDGARHGCCVCGPDQGHGRRAGVRRPRTRPASAVAGEDLAAAGPGRPVETFVLDIKDRDGLARLAAPVGELGPLRAVAHAAGVSPTMADWREVLTVDLVGTALLVEALRPLATEGTAIVCFASISALLAIPDTDQPADAALDEPLHPDFLDRLREAVGPELEDSGHGLHLGQAGGAPLRAARGRPVRAARSEDLLGAPRHHRHPDGPPGG